MSTIRSLAKNTAALAFGQLAARALGIVYVAALARYVHAEGMGQLATAQSLAGVTFLFVNLGLDMLAAREIAQRGARGPVVFSSLVALKGVLSVVALGGLALFSSVAGYPAATWELIVVYGLVMALGAFVAAGRSVFQARERLEVDAALQFGRDLANIGLSLLAIQLGASLLQLVWVSVLVSGAQSLLQLALLARFGLARLVLPPPREIGDLLRAGLPFSAATLIGALYVQAGPILLSILAGAAATGAFWAANNLLLVLLILPTMYAQAVFPVFARLHAAEAGMLRVGYQKSVKALTVAGMPMAAGTVLLAEPVIELVYGPGFQEAVPALCILAITLALAANFASGSVLIAVGRERFFAAASGGGLLAMVGLAVVLIPRWGPSGASLAYTIPSIAGFVLYTAVCHRLLHLELPLAMLARTAVATALMAGVVFAGLQAGMHFLWLAGLVGPLTYAGTLYLAHGVEADEWRLLGRVVQVHSRMNSPSRASLDRRGPVAEAKDLSVGAFPEP